MGHREDNQIIGVCRFSYLGTLGFKAHDTHREDLADRLYDEQRMQRRFAYFENICLPSLAAQTDMDFRLVVLTGDSMPLRWHQRLQDLQRHHPFVDLCVLAPAGPVNSTRRAFRQAWNGRASFITGFRIDDDDAVARDYIARTRKIADQLLALGWADAQTLAAICFHRGIYWDMSAPEDRQFWDHAEKEPLGLAAAMIMTSDARPNIFRWNHRHLASAVRCWIDPGDIMFLRTLHGHNDSDRTIPPHASALSPGVARRLLRDRFALSPAALQRMAQDATGDSP
jgi:hypothetical protein